jgi:hypothetical protein
MASSNRHSSNRTTALRYESFEDDVYSCIEGSISVQMVIGVNVYGCRSKCFETGERDCVSFMQNSPLDFVARSLTFVSDRR